MIELLLVFFGASLVARKYGEACGTTLVGPWIWLLVSLACQAATALLCLADAGIDHAGPWRFTVCCTTFCPLMALLGAKRPQDRGWQLVVATLLIVLSMPAWEVYLLRPGQQLSVHGLRSWFVALLILFGLINWSVSRFWPAGLLFAAGQLVQFSPFMPYGTLLGGWNNPAAQTYGLALIVAALLAGTLLDGNTGPPSPDRLWLRFRNRFGLFWGLRVMERVNAAALLNEWTVRLGWHGFYTTDGSPLSDLPVGDSGGLRLVLDNLLRRFVSRTWIAQQLGEPVDLKESRTVGLRQ